MGYNYNGRLRSAELLLKEDGSVEMICRAETLCRLFCYIRFFRHNEVRITVSKGLIPPVLAQWWENDLGTRPDMSIKWSVSFTICE